MTDSTDVLLKAAELLGEKGWCQKELRDDDGQMCAVGSIRTAARSLMWKTPTMSWDMAYYLEEEATTRVTQYLWDNEMIPRVHGVVYWNDEYDRTAEDVILALKGAATDVPGN